MLSKDQINQLKQQLLDRKDELSNKPSTLEEEASTELSNYDNHPADNATDLTDRETSFALDQHAEQELEQIEEALKAIENGTYGICRISGEEIPFERLEAIPTALTTVEHANKEIPPADDRPSEEDVIGSTTEDPYAGEEESVRDYENSFQEAANYGNSDTPSDTGHDTYDEMDEAEDEEAIADLEGKQRNLQNPDEE